MIREFFTFSLLIVLSVNAAHAGETVSLSSQLSALIRASLTEKIAQSEIRIPSLEKLFAQKPMSEFSEIKTARLIVERATGIAMFEVLGSDQGGKDFTQTIQTPFEAWRKVPVAIRRIFPNAVLKNEDFRIQQVNVAKTPARDYRGVMAAADTNFNGQQSKQTILEGQYVVDTAITQLPDVRKGDLVKLELISGDLTLTTQAMTEESALVGAQIRVMTTKTKRELVGRVKADHSVEVTL